MTLRLLEIIYSKLDFLKEFDNVFWVASITGFFLLFRKSNLLPDTVKGFNGRKQLRRQDLCFTDSNVVVGIHWAKNHQFGRKLLTFPLPRINGSLLCPVTALERLFKFTKPKPHEHVFKFSNGNSLTYRCFRRSCVASWQLRDWRTVGSSVATATAEAGLLLPF